MYLIWLRRSSAEDVENTKREKGEDWENIL
jgi:hypothetical protein